MSKKKSRFPVPTCVVSFDMGTRSMAYARVAAPCDILGMGIIDMQTKASRECTDRLHELLQDGEMAWIRRERVPVVVEAQPAEGACKVMTHGMQMFLLKEGDQHAYEHWMMMMAPNSKLLTVQQFYAEMPHDTRAQRKAIAMRTAEAIMGMSARNSRFREFYDRHEYKQRTDLADALAQAVRFLQLFNADTEEQVRSRLNTDDGWLTGARKRKFSQEQARAAHPDEFARRYSGHNERRPTDDDAPVERSDLVVEFGDE